MPVALVFGASGAIGRFLLPRLLADGNDVIAISRDARSSAHPHLQWTVGNLPAPVPALRNVDTIFSLGPLDAFAAWFAQSEVDAARVVAIGSLSAETKHDSDDVSERALAARLVDAERTLIAAPGARGSACTILRATLIYGAGLDRSLTPIVRFARRWRVFPYLSHANGLRQPVHADDLARACIDVARTIATKGRIYALGGGERLAFREMMKRVHTSMPFAALALPVPSAFARAGVALARHLPAFRAASPAALDRLEKDLVAEQAPAIADFGWSPRAFHPDASAWSAPPLP